MGELNMFLKIINGNACMHDKKEKKYLVPKNMYNIRTVHLNECKYKDNIERFLP